MSNPTPSTSKMEVSDESDSPASEADPMDDVSTDDDEYKPPKESNRQDVTTKTTEDELLVKFINGEITYTEYSAQTGQNDEELDLADLEEEPRDETALEEFEKEVRKSRRDTMRGNLQGESRYRRRHRHLPPALQGLMGEANLSFARGDNQLAEKFCLEIIKQVPFAYEPFITLAQIYEGRDVEKSVQFSLIAAHLNPTDTEQWTRIAELLVERNEVRKAITCYTKAIKYDPKNFGYRMRRIQLLESIDEEKFAMRCYHALIPHIPPEQGDFIVNVAKKVAKWFHGENNIKNALDAMHMAYEKAAKLFKTEDINLYLELLLEVGRHRRVVDVLCQNTRVEVDEKQGAIQAIHIPDELVVDFRTKLVIAVVHMKEFHLLPALVENVFAWMSVEDAGDCYLDIAEALMREENYETALQLLQPLVQSDSYNLPAVWLRHADCLRALGDSKGAIESYRRVVGMVNHLDARLTLAALLKQQGKLDDALEALCQDPESDVLDPGLLYEETLLLKEMNRLEEFIESGFLLLARHCIRLRNRQETEAMLNARRSNVFSAVRAVREMRSEPLEDTDAPKFATGETAPNVEQEWTLYLDLLRAACTLNRSDLYQRLAFTVLSSKRFQPFSKEVDHYAMLACIYNRDALFGYTLVKEMVAREPKSARLWNLFNLVVHMMDDSRYQRFLSRLLDKKETPPLVNILKANYYLSAGTYKYALNEYVSIFRRKKEPLVALLIAVTLTQIACQKFSTKKQSLLTQAVAFAEEYGRLREPEARQEVLYNMGRLYHQFGLLTLALDNYKRALEVNNDLIRAHPDAVDLRQDIAFNMHLIYKSSGNLEMARKVLFENIVA